VQYLLGSHASGPDGKGRGLARASGRRGCPMVVSQSGSVIAGPGTGGGRQPVLERGALDSQVEAGLFAWYIGTVASVGCDGRSGGGALIGSCKGTRCDSVSHSAAATQYGGRLWGPGSGSATCFVALRPRSVALCGSTAVLN
jgi:hypothetical protein